jgi:monoterpene epsilon-lactone hydrolase
MASEQADAVNRMYRERRDAPAPVALTLSERRAQAEHFGDATAEPEDVTFEDVDASGVAAQWVTPDRADTSRVLIYFHGGGYGYCSMRSHSNLVGHPAAVEDAVTAYRFLIERGVQPEHIAVAGDSAGGGLATALLVKARDDGLPLPAAATLLSPWVDLALTGESVTTRAETDFLSDAQGTRHCAEQFLAGQDPLDPYASPLYADLTGLPPLYIQAGDSEMLLDDSKRLADKAHRAGVDVRLDVFPEMQHIFQVWVGNMPEADEAVARIAVFLQARLGLAHAGSH